MREVRGQRSEVRSSQTGAHAGALRRGPLPSALCPLPSIRTGISLLEVLISIFILAVGLLSIASLLPVGGYQVQKASIDDRKSVIGQNAFHEFRTRGMSDVSKWIRPDGRPFYFDNDNDASTPRTAFTEGAVAIDPLCLTSGLGGNVSMGFPRGAAGATLPDGKPRMARVGLSFVPRFDIAEQIFMAHDDTVFEKNPADPDAPAISKWETSALRRQFEGNFSWLVTLTPSHFSAQPQPTTQYIVSIAIFFKRPLNSRTTAEGVEIERLIDLRQTDADLGGFGLGGGELVLQGNRNRPLLENQLNTGVRPGQWIMVCGSYPIPKGDGNYLTVPYFRWYRVVTAGEYEAVDLRGRRVDSRPITVAGPDWIGAAQNVAPANWPSRPSHVAIFEGCIGIYEKTVHLEGPSLYGG